MTAELQNNGNYSKTSQFYDSNNSNNNNTNIPQSQMSMFVNTPDTPQSNLMIDNNNANNNNNNNNDYNNVNHGFLCDLITNKNKQSQKNPKAEYEFTRALNVTNSILNPGFNFNNNNNKNQNKVRNNMNESAQPVTFSIHRTNANNNNDGNLSAAVINQSFVAQNTTLLDQCQALANQLEELERQNNQWMERNQQLEVKIFIF